MSGDVQPRKRKDKKRKKDDLGIEEPRGTAAVLGEGDVFMHSHHEHGTGGHWCAKIIFFSLLAVLVTLVGLIILENRGLTDLEAKSVESRYSGVLEGWIEEAPDDDHHDEHTLELKHHDDVGDHDEPSQEVDQEDEDEHNDEDDHEEIEDHDVEDEQNDDGADDNDDDRDEEDENENDEDDENSEEQNLEDADDEDDDEGPEYRRYVRSADHQRDNDDEEDDDGDDDDLQKVEENDSNEYNDENDQDDDQSAEGDDGADQSVERNADNDDDDDENELSEENDDFRQQSVEDNDNNDVDDDENNDDDKQEDGDSNEIDNEDNSHENEDEEEHDEEEADSGVEVEKLEKEISDDASSTEEPAPADSKEDDNSEEVANVPEDDDVDDEEEYLELDDIDEPPPVVEHIKVPAGKPLAEVEEDTTSEKPPDTLAEEEEYERRQEELRRERAEASHVWLKVVVGGALLVATHAVVRRATAPRDTPDNDEHDIREETPVIDRRMTLLPEHAAAPATATEVLEEIDQPFIEDEIVETVSSFAKSAPPVRQESEDVDEDEEIEIDTKGATAEPVIETIDKELYSDEEEEEEIDDEEIVVEEKVTSKLSAPVSQEAAEPEPEQELEDEEVPDDVEIIDDEQLEEDLEEEDEEDISDVDDADLLSRLEAKYGRLPMPEPDRPAQKHKDGGNSVDDEWPGEVSDAYWRQQLDQAEQELRQGEWSSVIRRAGVAELKASARAKWVVARALDASAEAHRDNALLSKAITAYLDLLKMNERLNDNKLRLITERTLERIRFRGNYLSAEPVYRLLIRRFPDAPEYRNNLTITYLMANRADLAEEVLKETLKRWPDDRVALAHYGFVLKTQHNRLEEAVDAFQKALKDDTGPATESRFYYHLGDSLLVLGRYAEAHEIHKRGAALGHFLSPSQRSLYNVDRLKSQPWWSIEQTPYSKLARALEKSWKEILKEGEAAKALYEKEREGLKERGEWSQLDLFVRGQEIPNRCKTAPVTCSIVRSELAAVGCRRGQVKFSSMEAGTHVRPHVGPTNCRLRMHLGLSNTKDTFIRVDQETRQWQVGKVLLFDDSFEHEVWHNGTGSRLVLIVDVWHPDLTPAERRSLPAI